MATIHDNKDKIRASSQVTTRWMHSRSLVMENMERLLSVWIEDQNQQNVRISVVLIQEKARSLSQDLKREQGEGTESETFGGQSQVVRPLHGTPQPAPPGCEQRGPRAWHGGGAQVPGATAQGDPGGRLHGPAGVQPG